jgi:hypothetical protein
MTITRSEFEALQEMKQEENIFEKAEITKIKLMEVQAALWQVHTKIRRLQDLYNNTMQGLITEMDELMNMEKSLNA